LPDKLSYTREVKKVDIPLEVLQEKYVKEKISIRELAIKLGVSRAAVYDNLDRYGIPLQPKGGGKCKGRSVPSRRIVMLTKEQLQDLWVDQGLTLKEIGQRFGYRKGSIYNVARRLGVRLSKEQSAQHNGRVHRKPDGKLASGYRLVYKPDHPLADVNGNVEEHRVIAELAIGRQLSKTEIVHHINMVKTDNRIENLAVLPKTWHHKIHWYYQKVGLYLSGTSDIYPNPVMFDSPMFWGGSYVEVLDIINKKLGVLYVTVPRYS
jgi:predicted DNA-binding protein YlxM (UPF0122 family)